MPSPTLPSSLPSKGISTHSSTILIPINPTRGTHRATHRAPTGHPQGTHRAHTGHTFLFADLALANTIASNPPNTPTNPNLLCCPPGNKINRLPPRPPPAPDVKPPTADPCIAMDMVKYTEGEWRLVDVRSFAESAEIGDVPGATLIPLIHTHKAPDGQGGYKVCPLP